MIASSLMEVRQRSVVSSVTAVLDAPRLLVGLRRLFLLLIRIQFLLLSLLQKH